MGCKGCTTCTTSSDGSPAGCGSKGNCATGGCNRLNTFDWLSSLAIFDTDPFDIVEVSFKNGARKDFYRLPEQVRTLTGDWVVVETGNGYDIGTITLSGDLVRMQMKKKRSSESEVVHQVIRKANERDMERLEEARAMEPSIMVRARAIARTLGLEMKIGDVEYQGDKRKATFYYTADGRVDFRELIRHFAKEFRIKIEMRQIGARQESARIGGLGSCGRELCCSTWLSDFKSVSTAAARYQNLAINQAKLSGQCGRLKCCLNYELDTYLEALEAFPEHAEKLRTVTGTALLIKTDVFKRLMYYVIEGERGKIYPMPVDKVLEIQADIKAGKPVDFTQIRAEIVFQEEEEDLLDFGGDVTGAIELPEEQKRRKKKRGNQRKGRRNSKGNNKNTSSNRSESKATDTRNSKAESSDKPAKNKEQKTGNNQKNNPRNRRKNNRRNRGGNRKPNNDNNNQNK